MDDTSYPGSGESVEPLIDQELRDLFRLEQEAEEVAQEVALEIDKQISAALEAANEAGLGPTAFGVDADTDEIMALQLADHDDSPPYKYLSLIYALAGAVGAGTNASDPSSDPNIREFLRGAASAFTLSAVATLEELELRSRWMQLMFRYTNTPEDLQELAPRSPEYETGLDNLATEELIVGELDDLNRHIYRDVSRQILAMIEQEAGAHDTNERVAGLITSQAKIWATQVRQDPDGTRYFNAYVAIILEIRPGLSRATLARLLVSAGQAWLKYSKDF